MKEDPRCCGTGSCIINDLGECWCGQRRDGEKMCYPVVEKLTMMELKMFEIWDGDLFLYAVDTEYEADEQKAAGFTVKVIQD